MDNKQTYSEVIEGLLQKYRELTLLIEENDKRDGR